MGDTGVREKWKRETSSGRVDYVYYVTERGVGQGYL